MLLNLLRLQGVIRTPLSVIALNILLAKWDKMVFSWLPSRCPQNAKHAAAVSFCLRLAGLPAASSLNFLISRYCRVLDLPSIR